MKRSWFKTPKCFIRVWQRRAFTYLRLWPLHLSSYYHKEVGRRKWQGILQPHLTILSKSSSDGNLPSPSTKQTCIRGWRPVRQIRRRIWHHCHLCTWFRTQRSTLMHLWQVASLGFSIRESMAYSSKKFMEFPRRTRQRRTTMISNKTWPLPQRAV